MFATDALVVILRDFFNLCTVCICFVSKVPQINKVVQNKSAVGISLSAVTLEIFRFAVLLCYNYCNGSQLLSYLEYPVLLLQQSTLVYFVLKFNNLLCTEIVLMSILVFITIALFMAEVLPKLLLTYLIVVCPVISASSRLIQLNNIVQAKRSDNISLASWFLTTFSSFARLSAILLDTCDKLLLVNSVTSFVTALSVYVAAIYYKKPSKEQID